MSRYLVITLTVIGIIVACLLLVLAVHCCRTRAAASGGDGRPSTATYSEAGQLLDLGKDDHAFEDELDDDL